MRCCPTLFLLLVVVPNSGCHRSSSTTTGELLVSQQVGTGGGELVVQSGGLAGLRLTIPPGALTETRELRIVAVPSLRAAGLAELSYAADPGLPFRIEPVGLRLGVPASLQAPFLPERILNTAPGNVVVQQLVDGAPIARLPVAVDVAAGWMRTTIDRLGPCQVVPGARVNLQDYWPALDSVVDLGDGHGFRVEPVAEISPFAGPAARRWRVTGPGQDLVLYFADDRLVGRESLVDDWREVWSQPAVVWFHGDLGLPSGTQLLPMVVQRPIGSAGVAGTITVFGSWAWGDPRLVGTTLVTDVLQLRIQLAWQRQDLGVGQTELVFTFAPGRGLLALAEDGVERVRVGD